MNFDCFHLDKKIMADGKQVIFLFHKKKSFLFPTTYPTFSLFFLFFVMVPGLFFVHYHSPDKIIIFSLP